MFQTSFEKMDIQAIAKEYGSPVYLYDIDSMIKRYHEIESSFKKLYHSAEVAVSYKTCPLMGVLTALHNEGAKAEVVSEYEFDLAQLLQRELPGKLDIVINGPYKTDRVIKSAILHGNRIHVDHMEEFYRIHNIAKELRKKIEIGVRVSLGGHWNRFGFPANKTLWSMLREVQSSCPWIEIKGIHLHIGTAIRSKDIFRQASNELSGVLDKWPFPWPVKWLDIGGGLAGISPRWEEKALIHALPSIEHYAQAWLQPLSNILKVHQPTIILEPGRTLFEPFGSLLSKVITCRHRDTECQSLVVDAGINALPTARVYRHPIYTEQQGEIQTDIYGPLCLQADTLAKEKRLPKLNAGDFLLIKGIGAYNQSRSVPFIQLRPGVLGLFRQKLQWLRKPETLGHHLRLEAWPSEKYFV